MSKARALFQVCGSLLSASFLLAMTPALARGAPSHVGDAESLLADLTVSRQNVYGSSPSYIKWSGTSSSARTVCGTFITNLLMHSYSWSSSTFRSWMGTTSPYATTYHDAIVAQNGFTRVTNIGDVQPGDIIAIKYPPGSGVTGHAMMVDSAPRSIGGGKYAVTVIDSSADHHGSADTRVTHPSTTHNGVGRGDVAIYADSSQTVSGYAWSTSSGSTYYSMNARPLAIGRLSKAGLSIVTNPPPQNGATVQDGGAVPSPDGGSVTQVIEDTSSGLTDDTTLAAMGSSASMDPASMDPAGSAALGGCSIVDHARDKAGSVAPLFGLIVFAGWLGLRRKRSRQMH